MLKIALTFNFYYVVIISRHRKEHGFQHGQTVMFNCRHLSLFYKGTEIPLTRKYFCAKTQSLKQTRKKEERMYNISYFALVYETCVSTFIPLPALPALRLK